MSNFPSYQQIYNKHSWGARLSGFFNALAVLMIVAYALCLYFGIVK